MKTYKPTIVREMEGGIQKIYKFKNSYDASVIRHSFSYGGKEGLWELAILYKGELVCDTPITDDIIGYLTEEKVQGILALIDELPERGKK